MTGHNHLMSNSYVAAYQAELKDAIRSARRGDNLLRAAHQRVSAWLTETRVRTTAAKRSRVASTDVRSFDRSSSTGACEISDGLAV
ncbi:MAG: hypothetical protein M3092_09345 [Actinomycetia bacterium]|nr:hypothetical protein [Actinomycetes bacterium]